jgi:hypothetical protein
MADQAGRMVDDVPRATVVPPKLDTVNIAFKVLREIDDVMGAAAAKAVDRLVIIAGYD